MKYTKLPNTDLKVSKICLGTMTWGEQNSESEGHDQMDYAVDQGVNFFDTAELYSVPAKKETQGSTESIIGSWFKKSGKRDQIVLASKIAGPGFSNSHIRNNGYSKEAITEAIDQSLSRLQTDYIDLYQLHWPERNTNFFGTRGYVHQEDEKWKDNFSEVLVTLEGFIKQGKIRHIGLSNETPYGIMRFLEASKENDLPRISTVQNPYSLLNRLYEIGSAEISMREDIGLLPYSPLGFGRLTEKHILGTPKDSRIALFPMFSRYNGENSKKAAKMYYDLAKDNGLSLAQMALAFVNQQPFVTSNIIGATNLEQLKENIDSVHVDLTAEIIKGINKIHELVPNPAP
ncbi:aldo/keto reductase [Zhouia amylolytica]|nr:aldo/keto reductase [Zhouia amylolytica]